MKKRGKDELISQRPDLKRANLALRLLEDFSWSKEEVLGLLWARADGWTVDVHDEIGGIADRTDWLSARYEGLDTKGRRIDGKVDAKSRARASSTAKPGKGRHHWI